MNYLTRKTKTNLKYFITFKLSLITSNKTKNQNKN